MTMIEQRFACDAAPTEPRVDRFTSRIFPKTEDLALGVICYTLVAVSITAAVGADLSTLSNVIIRSFQSFYFLVRLLAPGWFGVALAAGFLLLAPVRQRLWRNLPSVLFSIALCWIFFTLFSNVKNALPKIVLFWADPFLTRADLVLHLGHSPHDLLGFLAALHIGPLLQFYFNSWALFATFLPVLLIAFDGDGARRRVFIWLWMFCWVGLGNVLAVMFMSYGPIFADLFADGLTHAHAGALALTERSDGSGLLAIKMRLWHGYAGDDGTLGAGISAFPSVHVGMATVLGLYVARLAADFARQERIAMLWARVLVWGARVAAGLYIMTYVALSVWLGWHYAIDGYASVLVIGLAYLALCARIPRAAATAG